ncbi:MAG: DUF6164 family protein [Gammaproteobacteria bacterium]|nr:DUF6164 family protein [Gammaproteobacteria bacterium]
MATLLFRLNNVPLDEADEVRILLEEHQVDFYETTAGRWGISLAAIWLKEETQLERAKNLIAKYQRERQENAQREYQEQKAAGTHDTFLKRFLREPIKVLIYLLVAAVIAYFSTTPFLDL